jgi:hypothetical protein
MGQMLLTKPLFNVTCLKNATISTRSGNVSTESTLRLARDGYVKEPALGKGVAKEGPRESNMAGGVVAVTNPQVANRGDDERN